jgi:hypothetical protein
MVVIIIIIYNINNDDDDDDDDIIINIITKFTIMTKKCCWSICLFESFKLYPHN